MASGITISSKKILLLCAVLAVWFATSFFSEGYYHSDEHFQLIEFAGLKLGFNTPDDLAWEFRDQIRPAFQPAIAYLLIRTMNLTGITDPFTIAALLRVISALFSLAAIYLFCRSMQPFFKDKKWKKYFLLLSIFLWFIPFIQVRFSSECWATSCMLIAVAILARSPMSLPKKALFFYAGLLAGASFLFRYQMAFLIAGILLWIIFIQKPGRGKIIYFVCGFLLIIGLGALADRWFYGNWVFPPWNYYVSNILEGKAASFGIMPWWFYFSEVIVKGIAPVGFIIICCFLYFFYKFPKHILTWAIVPFLAVHFMTGHKELRFLFPLATLAPFILITSLMEINKRINSQNKILNFLTEKLWLWVFWIINIPALAVMCYSPADPNISQLKFINRNYKDKAVSLYYYKDNPYNPFGCNLNFYRFCGPIRLIPINNMTEIPTSNTVDEIFVLKTKRNNEKELGIDTSAFKLVYQSIPAWTENLNFNGWLDRTSVHRLYERRTTD